MLVRHPRPRLADARRRPGGHGAQACGSLADEVAFLSRPGSYPGLCQHVDLTETHFSWVFLTETHVYKLKKPVRGRFVDLRTLEARRRNCVAELRANRRFAPRVYEAVLRLTVDRCGHYCLDGDGETVDWLLRMRRLPQQSALDRVIARGDFDAAALVPLVGFLCRVYARHPVAISAAAYRARLAASVEENRRELSQPRFGLSGVLVQWLCAEQRKLLAAEAFEGRVRGHRIVEGHGDLRPEHVFLENPPVVIDSLEFSRELRIADAVDELAFLALECERLGVPQARDVILAEYARVSGDEPPPWLVDFYQSHRACVRARLAIRHLLDPAVEDRVRWPALAARYLELARWHLYAASLRQ